MRARLELPEYNILRRFESKKGTNVFQRFGATDVSSRCVEFIFVYCTPTVHWIYFITMFCAQPRVRQRVSILRLWSTSLHFMKRFRTGAVRTSGRNKFKLLRVKLHRAKITSACNIPPGASEYCRVKFLTKFFSRPLYIKHLVPNNF